MLGMLDLDAVTRFFNAVLSIFAIVNPIGSLPIFVSLTEDASVQERRRVFRLAGIIAFVIICVMAAGGNYLLNNVFGIGFEEFRFGGGLLLIVVGVQGILEKPVKHALTAVDPASRQSEQIRLAVSPIASPLLTGPGAIVTVMLIANREGVGYALAACLVCFAFVILILNYAHLVFKLLGKIGTLAIGRVMDIFIVAIGVNFIFGAVQKTFIHP